jgi:dolichol-phosphate mannosyltransferase
MATFATNAQDTCVAPSSVCVVLPAYNEERNLGNLLDRIDAALRPLPIPFQVIVVDDGSRDKTAEIITERSRRIPVVAVTHTVNAGLGKTIRDGLLQALKLMEDNAAIVTMDADETHDPLLIPAMLDQIRSGGDVVIASRYQRGAEVHGLSGFRKFMSNSASYLMRATHPIPGVRDYTCGFRAYRAGTLRRAVMEHGPRMFQAEGFHCMAEILLNISLLRVNFAEVPMILRYDLKKGESKMRTFRTARKTLALAFRRLK